MHHVTNWHLKVNELLLLLAQNRFKKLKVNGMQVDIGKYKSYWDTRCSSLLRHCTKSPKVAGSISDGVIKIFHSLGPSGHVMALGSTQHTTEMIKWGE